MFELHHLTASEQLDWLRRGEVSPLELAEHYLSRIERLNDSLGAFTTVTADAARTRAASLGSSAPGAAALWGLPLGDKDLVARAGVRTTYGSRLFADHVPEVSDELAVVLDAAGAVSLGKTNAPEFGLPSYTESLVAPPARNPWNSTLGAGGSSGGAAVAVSAGLLPVAPGSDGGGSVRIPAAATGLVGLKPARGRVASASGFTTLGGLVTAGPLARTVADAALLLDAITGAPAWATRPPSWDGGAFLNAAVRGEGRFQLGVMTSSPWDSAYEITISPEARTALDLGLAELAALGHGIEELALEEQDGYGPAFRTIWQAGAATIKADGDELEKLEPLTHWLVARGREVGARELGAALRELALFERSVIRQFAGFDAVVTPALAMTPRPVGWYDQQDAERNFEQQVQYTPWTSFVNVSGLPAITLPVAQTADGLPMGIQLIGRPGREDVLLAIGAQLERRLGWQRRHPPAWSA
ncbi:MAG: amidase [Rhodoglobus sp.]